VKMTRPNGTQASWRVSWTAPTSTGGLPIVEYYAIGSPSGFCNATAPETACDVSSGLLEFDQAYTFRVYGRSAAGYGDTSLTSAEVTPDGIAGAFAVLVTGAVKLDD